MQSFKMSKSRNEARTVPKMEGMNELAGQDHPGLLMSNRYTLGPQKSKFTMA
jgi:hypothetical protein